MYQKNDIMHLLVCSLYVPININLTNKLTYKLTYVQFDRKLNRVSGWAPSDPVDDLGHIDTEDYDGKGCVHKAEAVPSHERRPGLCRGQSRVRLQA